MMSQVLVLDALRRQLRKYLKETRFAAAWAPQLEGVLSAVRFHTQHNHGATAERAVQGLEVEMAEWTRLTGEGEAWSGLVLNVIARIDASLKAEAEVAATRYEQAHVGLALLRACFGAMEVGPFEQEHVSEPTLFKESARPQGATPLPNLWGPLKPDPHYGWRD